MRRAPAAPRGTWPVIAPVQISLRRKSVLRAPSGWGSDDQHEVRTYTGSGYPADRVFKAPARTILRRLRLDILSARRSSAPRLIQVGQLVRRDGKGQSAAMRTS